MILSAEHRLCGLMIALTAMLGPVARPDDKPFTARYRTALEAAGVPVTQESLAAFLRQHHVGADEEDYYDQLINKLGNDDFFVRESAMAALLQLSTQAAGKLQSASQSADPEIRWRAEFVLLETSKPRSDLLYAALVVVHAEEIRGLAEPLLGAAAVCQSEYLRLALTRALEATVTPADIPLLTRAIEGNDTSVRLEAFQALARIPVFDAVTLAGQLLSDPIPAVRLSAAEHLIRSGSRPAIDTLGELLDADEVAIRNRSAQLLQGTLKLTLPYTPYATPDERPKQAAKARAAIRQKLDGVPARDLPKYDGLDLGRILVCSYKGDDLIEIDGSGKTLSSTKVSGVADCQLLTGGRRLVAQTQRMRVVELDAAGQEIWKLEGLQGYPIRIRRLPNDNTLVLTMQGELREYNRRGEMLSSARFDVAAPRDLHVLPNGHLLLVQSKMGQIVELNEKREETWRSLAIEQLATICPTADDTLLAMTTGEQKVLELDRQGRVRPLPVEDAKPVQIQQLKDGRFLMLDSRTGLHLLDRNGRWIRQVFVGTNLTRFDATDTIESLDL